MNPTPKQIAESEAEEREAEAFVDAQHKACNEWLDAELPYASFMERSVARAAWLEYARRQEETATPTGGVETGEPRGPVHSCKNCAHLAKDSCDDPCAGCTVRWRSGVSDRWEPALGVSVARREPSTPSPTDRSAE